MELEIIYIKTERRMWRLIYCNRWFSSNTFSSIEQLKIEHNATLSSKIKIPPLLLRESIYKQHKREKKTPESKWREMFKKTLKSLLPK